MNKEDVFEAMEDIDEKYILQAGRCRKVPENSGMTSMNSSGGKEITLEVVEHKRKGLKLFAFITAAAVGTGAAAAAIHGTKKDNNNTFDERKITGYFIPGTEISAADLSAEFAAGLYGSGDTLYIPASGKYDENTYQRENLVIFSDAEGNISGTIKYGNDDNSSLCDIRKTENGETAVLYEELDYSSGVSRKYYVLNVDSAGGEFSGTELKTDCNITDSEFLVSPEGEMIVSLGSDTNGFFDSEGRNISTEKKNSRFISEFFRTGSSYYEWHLSESGGTVIRKVDFENHDFSDICELDFEINDAYDGFGSYDAVFRLNDGIYGYSFESNEITEIINWVDSDIEEPAWAVPVNDDVIVSSDYNYATDSMKVEILKRAGEDELKKIQSRKILTVATDNDDNTIADAARRFNAVNSDYRIHIADYSVYSHNYDRYSDAYSTGLSKLNQDIADGKIPDIVIFGEAFERERYSYSGAFEDLNKYMDRDAKTDRSYFFENILDAYSTDGKQYSIPLRFSLSTMAGKHSVAGNEGELSYDRLFELPENTNLFSFMTYNQLKYLLIESGINEYADYAEGKYSFDSEKFIKLLKLVKEYGITYDEYLNIMRDDELYEETFTGLYDDYMAFEILKINSIEDFSNDIIQKYEPAEIVLTGIPGDNGSEVRVTSDLSAAVTSASENREAAWKFISMLLSEEEQNSCYPYANVSAFPVRKSVYNGIAEKVKAESGGRYIYDCTGEPIETRPVSDEDISELTGMITSVNRAVSMDAAVTRIIDEEFEKYLSDSQTAEETAVKIQNRVSQYFTEPE